MAPVKYLVFPALVLLAGCASGSRDQGVAAALRGSETPFFLTGPMALALTNAQGYICHVSLERAAAAEPLMSGELVQTNGNFLFMPANAKGKRSGGFSFIWNS